MRELFHTIDDAGLSSRVESLDDRTASQQIARDRVTVAWFWLYAGIGVIATLVSFTFPQGLVLFLGYWVGGTMILLALRRLWLDPLLDAKYPLSRRTLSRRERRSSRQSATPVAPDASTSPARV